MKKNSQKGIIPILVLFLILLVVAGAGVAIVELISSDSGKDFAKKVSQYMDARFKKNFDYSQTPEKKSEYVSPEEAENADKKRTGNLTLRFKLTNFPDASEKSISISYDSNTISGAIPLTNQGNTINLKLSGGVDSLTGHFSGPLSATATQKVNAGKVSGSVTTEYTGSFSGQIDITGKASGYLALNQKITNIEGNVPQLKVGDTNKIQADFTGLATPK